MVAPKFRGVYTWFLNGEGEWSYTGTFSRTWSDSESEEKTFYVNYYFGWSTLAKLLTYTITTFYVNRVLQIIHKEFIQ